MNKQLKANHSQLIFSILKIVGILFIFYFYKADIYIFFYWQILISFLILIVQKYFIYQELNEWNLLSFFSSNYLKHIRKLSLGITLIGVFGFIYADLNNIFLAKWLSLKDYGQYNILFNIVLAMIMYCATIKNAIFPHIAILVQSNDINEIKTKFIDYSKLVSYTLIPISIIVSIFSFDVLNLWLHNIELTKNIETSLPWITIGSLLNSLMIIPFTFLLANIKTKFLVIQSGILALISIPFLYFLIQKFGFKGASMYWFFINLIPFLFLSLYINKMIQIDIKSKWKKIYSMPLIYSFFLIVVVFLIKFIINKNPI